MEDYGWCSSVLHGISYPQILISPLPLSFLLLHEPPDVTFRVATSNGVSPTHSSGSYSDASSIAAPQPTASTVVQVVNIRSHVPILLDMAEPNYNLWRCFFDSCALPNAPRRTQRWVAHAAYSTTASSTTSTQPSARTSSTSSSTTVKKDVFNWLCTEV